MSDKLVMQQSEMSNYEVRVDEGSNKSEAEVVVEWIISAFLNVINYEKC